MDGTVQKRLLNKDCFVASSILSHHRGNSNGITQGELVDTTLPQRINADAFEWIIGLKLVQHVHMNLRYLLRFRITEANICCRQKGWRKNY
jgi:hypothetical protein